MKVGDLVKYRTVGTGIVGVVFELDMDLVGVILAHNNKECWFQPQHLEVISESR